MNLRNITTENKPARLLLTVITGLAGGFVFTWIHIPLPWILGPMAAIMAAVQLGKARLYMPPVARNLGLMLIGYGSGSSFTRDTLTQIVHQLPWMALMTAALIACGAATALVISRFSGADYLSVLAGSMPGGLTQIVILAEETKGLDVTVVTFLQVLRLIMVVICVPLLVFSPVYPAAKAGYRAAAQSVPVSADNLIPKIILFAGIVVVCALLASKLKFPTPYLLGPLLGVAVFNISVFRGPALSPVLLDIAQFTVGCYLGLLMKPGNLENKAKLLLLSVINGLVMVAFAFSMGFILIALHGIDPATAFLCMAPGGADQMSVIASVISADVALVTGYQMFRMLFVFIAVPSMLKWVHNKLHPSDKDRLD
jgi:hypothetical protein